MSGTFDEFFQEKLNSIISNFKKNGLELYSEFDTTEDGQTVMEFKIRKLNPDKR